MVQSSAYLKQIGSSPILISKSFKEMFNNYAPMYRILYLLPVKDHVIVYHPLYSVL